MGIFSGRQTYGAAGAMKEAARVLDLAQQTAEQAIADATREAERIIAEAKRDAEAIRAQARADVRYQPVLGQERDF
jgi:vacuolar-type H+-ATPase subunit E/Vma4